MVIPPAKPESNTIGMAFWLCSLVTHFDWTPTMLLLLVLCITLLLWEEIGRPGSTVDEMLFTWRGAGDEMPVDGRLIVNHTLSWNQSIYLSLSLREIGDEFFGDYLILTLLQIYYLFYYYEIDLFKCFIIAD